MPRCSPPASEERVLAALMDDILCPSNVKSAMAKMSEELTGPYEEQTSRLEAIEHELLSKWPELIW